MQLPRHRMGGLAVRDSRRPCRSVRRASPRSRPPECPKLRSRSRAARVWVRPVSTSASGRRSEGADLAFLDVGPVAAAGDDQVDPALRRARRKGPRAYRRRANGGGSGRSPPTSAADAARSGCRRAGSARSRRCAPPRCTRSRVSGCTFSGWRSTRDTVILVTPARAAMSAIRRGEPMSCPAARVRHRILFHPNATALRYRRFRQRYRRD